MSGTSCDGIDAALVEVRGTGAEMKVSLHAFKTYPYDDAFRHRLLEGCRGAPDLCRLDRELGVRFAGAAASMIGAARQMGLDVDFVASHGHTVAHVPPGRGPVAGTLQIGSADVIAERTARLVVSDFRPRDMAAGGHGAPLVPYADWVLFRREDATVATLNIGGIANFTVVTPELENVFAFDTGPGNMTIDGAMRLLTHGRYGMDRDGATAAEGNVLPELLAELLDHPYFAQEPPKSAGREIFGPGVYLEKSSKRWRRERIQDVMATVTMATARSIADAYRAFIEPKVDVARLIVSGGGTENKTLMNMLSAELPGVAIRTTDHYKIPSDAREAIAFAILGNETLCGTPNNAPCATGSKRRVVLGKITPAQ